MNVKDCGKGFVLLEVLVSLLVFSIGIVFLIQSLAHLIQSSKTVRENQIAYHIIDNALNRFYSRELDGPSGQTSIAGDDYSWELDDYSSSPLMLALKLKVQLSGSWDARSIVFEHSVMDVTR